MKAAAVIVVAALVGCGDLVPLPCTGAGNGVCRAEGMCINGFCANADGSCASGYRFDDSAGSLGGTCADPGGGSGSGSGSENFADDPVQLAPNETFMVVDASHAVNDIEPGCGATGGVDVMFDIDVVAPKNRLYIDTYSTTYDVVLAVFTGPCAAVDPSKKIECVESGPRACSATAKQWSRNLSPGSYCIVVDQATTTTTHPTVTINLAHELSAPDAIVGSNGGTTCGHDEWFPAAQCTAPNGPDATWFFMSCGGNYEAVTTPSAWPGDLEAYDSVNTMECQVGQTGVYFDPVRPAPAWFIAHQAAGSCGPLSLVITKL